MSMMLYIAEVYGKIKPGITKKAKSRIISYDKGNNNPIIHYLYVAMDGYDGHGNNCESYVMRELFPYLENPQGNRKPSEYVDPKYDQITPDYVRDLVEDRIKCHPLKMRRVKKVFLPITRYNMKTVVDGIKNFPDKYLEDIT